MKAEFSAYNLYTQLIDYKEDPPVQLKHANNIKIEVSGEVEIDKQTTQTMHFPYCVSGISFKDVNENEGFALDLGYNLRIMCDKEYLRALVLAIFDCK